MTKPDLSEQSHQQLRDLWAWRKNQIQAADESFAAELVRTQEREQVSVRELARALALGPSTVQDWLARGRQLTQMGDCAGRRSG